MTCGMHVPPVNLGSPGHKDHTPAMLSRSLDSLEGRGLINEERNVSNSDPFYNSECMARTVSLHLSCGLLGMRSDGKFLWYDRCDEECADCCDGGAVKGADRGCAHPAQPRQVGLESNLYSQPDLLRQRCS